ncbi:recombinase family protein [Mesorhizobium sp. M1403]|uniref:recombinase family protein n=1 Tax=Mesorhizobium sp. M1403 TaxID=2957097 RepID=UPI00333B39C8
MIWDRLTHSRVIGLLTNPSYAGTYVFARYRSSKAIGPDGGIETQTRCMPDEEWWVVIDDHHPGYITPDQFLAKATPRTAPKARCSAALPAKGSASCRACLSAAHAGACAATIKVRVRIASPMGAPEQLCRGRAALRGGNHKG